MTQQLQNGMLEMDARIRALHHIAIYALELCDKQARAAGEPSPIDGLLKEFIAYDPKAAGFGGENLSVEVRKKFLVEAHLREAQGRRARKSN
jgi:hypothetical protein